MTLNCGVQEDIPPSSTASVPHVPPSFNPLDTDIPPSPAVYPPRSNEISDPPETLLIGNLRSFARNTFSFVLAAAAKIWIILKFLARLVNKTDTLVNTIPATDYLQSPIRYLPEELLSYIFLLCLPVSRKDSSFDISASPLLLMLVCKAWRQCALSSQALWTSFTIRSDHAVQPSLVRTWMLHAQGSPLSPCLILKGGSQDRLVWLAGDEVIRCCKRWRSLHIESPTDMLRHIVSIQGRLSSLEFLHIKIDDTPNYHQTINAFASAPRLRAVKLLSYVLPSQLRLPWDQISSLELTLVLGNLSHLKPILQCSLNLVDLKVVYLKTSPAATSEVHIPPIDLSHLRRLRIAFPGTEDISGLLRCPNLTHLSLWISGASLEQALPLSFVATLSSLRVLDLQAYSPEGAAPPDLVPCLLLVPTVTSLRIGADGNAIPSNLLSALVLTVGSADRILLPRLEELAIQLQENSIVNDRLVSAASLSRAEIADIPGLVITLVDHQPWIPREDRKHSDFEVCR